MSKKKNKHYKHFSKSKVKHKPKVFTFFDCLDEKSKKILLDIKK